MVACCTQRAHIINFEALPSTPLKISILRGYGTGHNHQRPASENFLDSTSVIRAGNDWLTLYCLSMIPLYIIGNFQYIQVLNCSTQYHSSATIAWFITPECPLFLLSFFPESTPVSLLATPTPPPPPNPFSILAQASQPIPPHQSSQA